MNFILKIVEGPNKGAEAALVEGVVVTLGKGDDCDIVLADPTMPEAPLRIETAEGGVTVDGEPLPPYHVMTSGSTSFATGPADVPWKELVWPKKEEEKKAESAEAAPPPAAEKDAASEAPAPPPAAAAAGQSGEGKKRRGGCLGCLVVLVLVILVLAGLGWYFKKPAREFYDAKLARYTEKAVGMFRKEASAGTEAAAVSPAETLKEIAERYSLTFDDAEGGETRLSGNLATRAERLRATAEAYAAKPGVLLDLSDDESFRVSADDALFTLTEGAVKAVVATNRFLEISGAVRSAESLKKVLVALAADLPKLRDVDASRVAISAAAAPIGEEPAAGAPASDAAAAPVAKKRTKKQARAFDMPVCGILTTPYPCLVMRDGSRVMEGASVGDSVVLKIEADAVTVTNSTGRLTWKP